MDRLTKAIFKGNGLLWYFLSKDVIQERYFSFSEEMMISQNYMTQEQQKFSVIVVIPVTH